MYLNFTSDLSSYRKHLLVFLRLNWKLGALVFRWKKLCFKVRSTGSMFWLVGNEIKLLWALYRKKQRFCFLFVKTRCTLLYSTKNMFWFVCRKVVLFPALLHRKELFFQFAASHPYFHMTLLKRTFSHLQLLVSVVFLALKISYFHHVLVYWQLLLKLWALCHNRTVVSFSVAKYAAFIFIAPKKCFWWFAGKSSLFGLFAAS